MKQLAAVLALCTLGSACLAPPADPVEQTSQPLVANPKKVAYYPIWPSGGDDLSGIYPQAPGSLAWTKLTHINVAFVVVNASWQCVFQSGSEQSAAQALINYRNTHNLTAVKILLAVGGWTDSQFFSEAFMNSANRTTFVNSCVSLVNSMGADGLDIDWEYPTSLGAGNCPSGHTCQRAADKTNLTLGLDQFRAHAGFSGKLLTAAIGANGPTSWYDYANFFGGSPARLDWINLMTYDFHGEWENTVNFTAPYGESTAAMNYLLTAGIATADKHRVVMGIPFYGPAWRSVTGSGTPGSSTGTFLGSVAFRKAKAILDGNPGQCSVVTTGNNRHIWCGTVTIDGTVRSNVWISYEDPFVVGAKGDFVASNNWGGMMWWAQGDDTAAADLVSAIDSKLQSGPPTVPAAPTGLVASPGNGQVSLSWNAAPGANNYTLKSATTMGGPYTPVPGAINTTATSFNHPGLTNGTTYYYVVSASNAAGEGPNSSEVSATPVASSWSSQDIGAVAAMGSWSLNSMTGLHTIQGNGADIWTATDEFRFTYQPLTGDGTITARVVTFTGTGTVNANAKAGVMIRRNLDADSPHLLACLPPQGQTTPIKHIKRLMVGATSTSVSGASPSFPRWVRVTRSGNTLTAYESANGTTFTALGTPQTISSLDATAFVGLAVTSHVDGTNYTATFDNVTITTPTPPAPPVQAAATPGNNQCVINWSASAGASDYTVKRSTVMGAGHTALTAATNITGLTHTDTTAVNGTTYYYVVTARNAAGSSGSSNEQSCTPQLPPPPGIPPNPGASPGNRQVTVTWGSVAGATGGYNVKFATTAGGPYTLVPGSPFTPTSATHTSLTNGQPYFYVVTALGPGGESASSSEVTATPSLPAPTGLVATPGDNQVSLDWSDLTNATGYLVKRGTTAGGPYPDLLNGGNPVTLSTFVDSTAVNGTTYHYVVSGRDGAHEGPDSSAVSATPSAQMAPAAPSNLTAVAVAGGITVRLTWADNSSNEAAFRIERKTGTGAYATLATKTAGTTLHDDTTAVAGNTYTYRVIATGSPDSAPSNQAGAVLRGMEADAYVRGGTNGTLNYGAATVLEAKTNSSPPENNRQFYVRFTLTDVLATVSSAKLRIYGNANTAAKIIAVAGVSNITWVEGTGTGQAVAGITYNNKPAAGAQITSQSVGITAGFWEFDITSYVQAQKTAGATKISLAVTQTTVSPNGQTSFNSKENATVANRPLVLISSK